ncbi:MAG: hypothetical protein AVDCRST_MAG88-692, partial [uncultured Thermomicrobiales bacterium]
SAARRSSIPPTPTSWWSRRARFGPMSPAAKRQGRILALPLLAVLLGGPALSTWRLRQRTEGHLAFASAFAHAYALLVVCNLVDLLVIDYLLLVRLRPSFAVLPGTAGMAAYDDLGFHVTGFGKGLGFGLVPSAAIAWFASRRHAISGPDSKGAAG